VTGLFFKPAKRGAKGKQSPCNGEERMNIHLVEPLNHFVKIEDNVWESGWWNLDESEAKKLVGGEIYFHKKRQEPSFYGGTILGYRINDGGEYQGRVIFKLKYSQACRNIRTTKSGWTKDVKIAEAEGPSDGR
jgi:hypothetical protein